jgi:DNA-binding transcriptional ArsR family regulator
MDEMEVELSPLARTVVTGRALGHPARVRTLAALSSGELCMCQITEMLQLAPSTVTAHLKELHRAGLTTERKDGRWVYVGLATDAEAAGWLETALAAVAGDPQLVIDQQMVEEMRRLPVADLCRFGYARARAMHAAANQHHEGSPNDTC